MNTPEALTPPHLHETVKVSYLPRRDAGCPLSASLSVCEVEAKDRRSAGAAELVPAVEPVSDPGAGVSRLPVTGWGTLTGSGLASGPIGTGSSPKIASHVFSAQLRLS